MSSLQSPSDASARNDLVYGLDDRPSAPHRPARRPPAPAGDHRADRYPGLLICQALGVSPRDTNLIVSMSLVISGIATFVQCKRFGPFGAGLLIVRAPASTSSAR